MNIYLLKRHILFRMAAVVVLLAFGGTVLVPVPMASAQTAAVTSGLSLPAVGASVPLSEAFVPLLMKGIKVFPDNPLRFDFIVDTGDSGLNGDPLTEKSNRLIKYFLAALTVPEEDFWVNLSPYEADRIIPEEFGITEMGRDLLAQDYILKQVTASLMYPEDELGEEFWARVHEEAYEKYGTTDIPVDTFNKVWIVPEKAVVYQNAETHTAFVVESRLKVMLEEDYVAMEYSNRRGLIHQTQDKGMINHAPTKIIREILLPAIEQEVNEGTNFAPLRQIYHSLILATWYKQNLRESILGKLYIGKNKVGGVDIDDKQTKEKIYTQYLAAFKQGVHDYIKEDYDPITEQIIPRKYFSGGATFIKKLINVAMVVVDEIDAQGILSDKAMNVSVVLDWNRAGSSVKIGGFELYREGINAIFHAKKLLYDSLGNATPARSEEVLKQKLVIGGINNIVLGDENVISLPQRTYRDKDSYFKIDASDYLGLKNLIYFPNENIYVMDNDVPFYMWNEAAEMGKIKKEGNILIFIDQHTDRGSPNKLLESNKNFNLEVANEYSTNQLGITTSMHAAIQSGLVKEIFFISKRSYGDLEITVNDKVIPINTFSNFKDLPLRIKYSDPRQMILHTDLDYFNKGSLNKSIDYEEIDVFVRSIFQQGITAGVYTLATSPGYVREENMVPGARIYVKALLDNIKDFKKKNNDTKLNGCGVFQRV